MSRRQEYSSESFRNYFQALCQCCLKVDEEIKTYLENGSKPPAHIKKLMRHMVQDTKPKIAYPYCRLPYILSLYAQSEHVPNDLLAVMGLEKSFSYYYTCENCHFKSDKMLKPCTGCWYVAYCSKECQLAHWKSGHKRECSELSEMKKHSQGAEVFTFGDLGHH